MAAGWNFGCGSSREHAPIAIKESGVACVIAKSFARIFYRNAINIGLPIFECEAASDGIAAGDEVRVDFDTGLITNLTKNEMLSGPASAPVHSEHREQGRAAELAEIMINQAALRRARAARNGGIPCANALQ